MNNLLIRFLVGLKNASNAKKEVYYFSYNKLCLQMLDLLYTEGLIQTFSVVFDSRTNNKKIKTVLRYNLNKPILKNFTIISKPSNSKFLQLKDLYKLSEKKRIFVLSTSWGFLTSLECKQTKIGGKILFIC